MKVVVFGGSGFLGSHTADILTDRGYEVVIYDKTPSPYLRDGQEMILGDILDEEGASRAVQGADYVYNFAGIADLDDAKTRPIDTVKLNVLGNVNIMDAAIKARIKRYIYASTVYVYSQKGGFYRCSKQSSEIFLEEYQYRFGLEYTILRYGTLYGPRSDCRNSVYRYIEQALKENRIVYSGSDQARREYIHVRDAARLSVDILDEKYKNRHIILTGHYPLKFEEIAMMIQEMLGKEINIVVDDQKNPDHYAFTPYSYVPKIGDKLVNHCYVDMGQGLLECIDEIYQQSGSSLQQGVKTEPECIS